MAKWVKRVFIDVLPRLLCMQRPDPEDQDGGGGRVRKEQPLPPDYAPEKPSVIEYDGGYFPADDCEYGGSLDSAGGVKTSPDLERAVLDVRFIAQHMENLDNFTDIESDWQYVAMVLDRLFLWIFTIACVVGTGWIILCAPALYDDKQPIDVMFSKVAPRIRRLLRN